MAFHFKDAGMYSMSKTRSAMLCRSHGVHKRLILKVGLTNSQVRTLYQDCALMNFNLDWDRSIIDLTVPGEKTESLWSSRTSQLVRKIGTQNQCMVRDALCNDVCNAFHVPHALCNAI